MQGLIVSALASLGGRKVNCHLYELSAFHTDFILVKLWQEETQTTRHAKGKPTVSGSAMDVLCHRQRFSTHFVSR